jgi:UDP-glucose 4-epimerase
MADKRVVVTGGAGFIGSHLVDALATKCGELVVLDDLSVGKLSNIAHHTSKQNFQFVRADVRDLQSLRTVFQPGDVVFHLAVECLRVALFDPIRAHRVNATGSLNVCIAAHENGAERLIYVSSSEVYGTAETIPMDETHPLRPTTTYGADKAAGELTALAFWRTYGFPVIVVRPFNAYGPREHVDGPSGEVIPRFVERAMNGQRPIIFGDGSQTRDFTWVVDTARGILEAGQCDELIGQEVNIARGEEVSINDLARLVIDATGQSGLEPEYRPAREGDVKRHLAGTRKAKELLGFASTVAIEQGISNYVRWIGATVDAKARALASSQDAEVTDLMRPAKAT